MNNQHASLKSNTFQKSLQNNNFKSYNALKNFTPQASPSSAPHPQKCTLDHPHTTDQSESTILKLVTGMHTAVYQHDERICGMDSHFTHLNA
jgi:hypothetical protein